MKIGMIDVGGGLRGSFGAGVMDRCLADRAYVDYGIGVSAGSANIASYLAGQMGRNYIFYTKYTFRKEYMSLQSYLKDRNYIDLDYVYSTLSDTDGEYPLDYQALLDSGKEFYIVATNALDGQAKYFTDGDGMSLNHYDPLKASCCVPIVDQPYMIDGIPYVDGGLSDPLPVKKALLDGCDAIVLVLTKPRGHISDSVEYDLCARWLDRKGYHQAAEGMRKKVARYNEGFDIVEAMEKDGRAVIVAPQSLEGMKTLTKDVQAIKSLYMQGYKEGRAVKTFIDFVKTH